MRLSCRRRSISVCEDILPKKFEFDDIDDNCDEDDDNYLRERQCNRRMAVVLD